MIRFLVALCALALLALCVTSSEAGGHGRGGQGVIVNSFGFVPSHTHGYVGPTRTHVQAVPVFGGVVPVAVSPFNFFPATHNGVLVNRNGQVIIQQRRHSRGNQSFRFRSSGRHR